MFPLPTIANTEVGQNEDCKFGAFLFQETKVSAKHLQSYKHQNTHQLATH